jgi:uncharacterized glyoxalase superfamily protein PhnB
MVCRIRQVNDMARQTPSEKADRMIAKILLKPRAAFTSVELESYAAFMKSPGIGLLAAVRELPREKFKERLRKNLERRAAMTTAGAGKAVHPIREGFHSITPYLVVPRVAQLIEFLKAAFGAEERFRMNRPGTEVIMHAELKIGDSMLEMADANEQFPPTSASMILGVEDVDAVFGRAVEAGATVLQPVADHEYGARSGSVIDGSGNTWTISKSAEGNTIFEEFRSITPYFNPLRAPAMIEFLQKAFGGREVYRAQSPDGVVHHAQVRIGDSVIGMGEAHGPYQPAPATLHLYVPDADAVYESALRAGATSIQPIADQPYGDRSGGVTDPFGNRWFIATHIRDVAY